MRDDMSSPEIHDNPVAGIGPSESQLKGYKGSMPQTELPGSQMPDVSKFQIGAVPKAAPQPQEIKPGVSPFLVNPGPTAEQLKGFQGFTSQTNVPGSEMPEEVSGFQRKPGEGDFDQYKFGPDDQQIAKFTTEALRMQKPPDPNDPRYRQEQNELHNNYVENMWDREGALSRTLTYAEKGIGAWLEKDGGQVEIEIDYEKASREMIAPVTRLINDSRLRLNPSTYTLQHQVERISTLKETVEASASSSSPAENRKNPELRRTNEILQSRLHADMVRLEAMGVLAEHAAGLWSVYFDGKFMTGIVSTGRRMTVLHMADMAHLFGTIKDRALKPENIAKVENAPDFFKDTLMEMASRDAARINDITLRISAMNRSNPFKESGTEMPVPVSTVQQELIGKVFERIQRTDEKGNSEKDWATDKTQKITIHTTGPNKGKEVRPGDTTTDAKEVWVNVLAYETTLRTEAERKRYEASLMAVAMLDVDGKLKNMPANIKNLSVDQRAALDKLIEDVKAKREEIIEDWDSPRIDLDRAAAETGIEISYALQVGTMKVADTGLVHEWKKDKSGRWSFVAAAGSPSRALDAINAKYAFLHELTYRYKNRVATPLLPPGDRESLPEWINMVSTERNPEELKRSNVEQFKSNAYLLRGAGILGLYPDELGDQSAWLDGEKIRQNIEKGDGNKGMELNEELRQTLEQTIWMLPTAYGKKVPFPMPIKTFFDSYSMLDAMSVSKSVTVQDLQDGKLGADGEWERQPQLLTEINYENYDPNVEDGVQASSKMIMEITKMMYGRMDPRELDGFFSSPYSAITEMHKWLDIGTRNEVAEFDYVDPATGKTEKKNISPKTYEITYSTYMAMAYLAFYKYGLWDGGEKFMLSIDEFNKPAKTAGGKLGFPDFVRDFYYQGPDKQGYSNYNESHVLMMLALKDFVYAIGGAADEDYSKYIEPVLSSAEKQDKSKPRG